MKGVGPARPKNEQSPPRLKHLASDMFHPGGRSETKLQDHADTGIDGFIYFKPDARTTEKAVVSVKGGENVNVAMVRDLAHVVKREKAEIGVFITLAEPTRPMLTEAVKEGFYETVYGKFPRLQILTVAELLDGKQPQIPWVDPAKFKKAAREQVTVEQDTLPF